MGRPSHPNRSAVALIASEAYQLAGVICGHLASARGDRPGWLEGEGEERLMDLLAVLAFRSRAEIRMMAKQLDAEIEAQIAAGKDVSAGK